MKEKLIEIGLNEHEAEIYLFLLENQKITAGKIAKKLSINRTVVYFTLEKLLNKGLANQIIINSIKHFSASNPKYLKNYLDDKQDILKQIMPFLQSKNKNEKLNDFSCEMYQGLQGGIVVLKDILRDGKDYVSFGDEGQLDSASSTVVQQYVRQLDENNIKERILTKKGIKYKYNRKKTEIRYLSKNANIPAITTVYGNKVIIAVLEDSYHVLLIKSKQLARTYKSIFEVLWKTASKSHK